MTIDVGSRVPFHEQLAAILREKIRTGEIDSRVPSIVTLAQEYGVASRTAAHALGTLADEGLIVAVREGLLRHRARLTGAARWGTFVR